MGLVLGLVVGGVEIVDAASEARLHDGEVLIGEGHVDADVGAVGLEEAAELFHGVGVHAVGGDVGGTGALGQTVAFLLCARGDYNLGEDFRMLGALEGHYRSDASGADDYYFSHVEIVKKVNNKLTGRSGIIRQI